MSHQAQLALSPILSECPPPLPNPNHLQELTGDSPSQAVCGLGCVRGRASPIRGVGPWGQWDIIGCVDGVAILVIAPTGYPRGRKRFHWLLRQPPAESHVGLHLLHSSTATGTFPRAWASIQWLIPGTPVSEHAW